MHSPPAKKPNEIMTEEIWICIWGRGGWEATQASVFSWALALRCHWKHPTAVPEPQTSVPKKSMSLATASSGQEMLDQQHSGNRLQKSRCPDIPRQTGLIIRWQRCKSSLRRRWKGSPEEMRVKSHFTFGTSDTEIFRKMLTKGLLTQKSATVSCETWAVAN